MQVESVKIPDKLIWIIVCIIDYLTNNVPTHESYIIDLININNYGVFNAFNKYNSKKEK